MTGPDADLADLARRAARGDSVAFRALVDATHVAVYRVALRVGGDAAEAEDVVQEVYVRAWQKLSTLNDPNAVLGWLARIARNVATDRVRSRKSRPQTIKDADAARLAVEQLVSDAPHGERRTEQAQTSAVVRAAIDSIDERYRTALLLRDVDGLSAAEAATLLGVPVGTVESRASRGRQKLADKLLRLLKGGQL